MQLLQLLQLKYTRTKVLTTLLGGGATTRASSKATTPDAAMTAPDSAKKYIVSENHQILPRCLTFELL
jgi:hypothetical protein